MTHTTREQLLWAGYTYAQEQEWKQKREKLTQRWKATRKTNDPA